MNFIDFSGPPAFEIVTKPFGPICNLDCSYCFYLKKEELFPNEHNWAMKGDALESFIRQTISAHKTPLVRFVWQGGEPTLLGIDYFRNVTELQKRYANGKQIENAFQTNGVQLDDQWCAFLRESGFLVGISIDGPARLHDCYRLYKGGQPTFDKVLRGLRLLKTHGVEFNTLTCVHHANEAFPLEVYRFLKSEGVTHMQFIPIVEPSEPPPFRTNEPIPVSDRSVNALKFGRFLSAIFDEWYKKDYGKVFVQTFEVALQSWIGLPQSLCVFSETCGNALALEHNGDLYSCDHFVYDGYRLGNILTTPLQSMVNSLEQREFGFHKRDSLPSYCRSCDVRFACNGECPKNRIILTPDGEPGLNYLCEGYKYFFHHITPTMDDLADHMRKEMAKGSTSLKT